MLYAPFRNLAVPGSVRYYGTITPSVSGTLDDWTPTDFDNAYAIILDPSAATTITGMGSALDGIEKLLIHGGDDDFPIEFTHQDGASTSGLRLENGLLGDFVLHRGDCVLYRRESAEPRWRLVSRQTMAYDQVRRPSFFGRTEASWWKVAGSNTRARRGMVEAEDLKSSATLSIDDSVGPLMSASTGTTPYDPVTAKDGACGLRTRACLFQPRWNVMAAWDRVSAPSTLANTRARWGCFATNQIFGIPDPADLEGAYFQFDYDDDVALVKAITSSGADFTETELPTAPPGTKAEWWIEMTSSVARFYHDGSLVAEHDTDLPGADTMLGHSIAVELLAGGSTVKRFTWARSGYSFGRASA